MNRGLPRLSTAARLLAVALLATLLPACEPLTTLWDEREDFPVLVKEGANPPAPPSPLQLKVMTWNVKYGAGRVDFWFDMWGDNVSMTRQQVETNMAGIYKLINEVKPDILLTNEIEVGSRRSAFYDMVKGILEHTDLNYAAYTPTWQNRMVPSDGLGRVNMGNAIFSRFPIKRSERIPQPDRTDQDVATARFYLHRALGRAVIDVGREVAVYTVHTEAYDMDQTNKRQQAQLLELMKQETLPLLVAGDLNALPPGSVKVHGFNDEHPSSIGTDFEQPPYNPEDLQPFYDSFTEAIGLDRYGTTEAEQSRYYTHTVLGGHQTGTDGEPGFWNRRLDYMFIRPADAWVPGTTDVLQKPGDSGIQSDPMPLSDHCPVIGVWEIAP